MVLNRRLGWLPGVQNNTAELFANYEESIQAKATWSAPPNDTCTSSTS